jgi:hypothetical protein
MGTLWAGGTAHQPLNLGRRATLVVLLVCCACAGRGDRRAEVRRPQHPSERPTGCIDTPHIGGDHRATTTGIPCGGRPHSAKAVLVHGRVTALVAGELPGAGIEDLWVGVHPLGSGPVIVDALPAARGESRTGPQGTFSISFVGTGEYVVTVRAEASGPVLAARRVTVDAGDRSEPVNLQVSLDGLP